MEVSKEDFEKISRKIREMEDSKEQLHYSRLGVIFCLMGIPFRRKNHYFCSQFVTEMLKMSGMVLLGKDSSLYLPNDLPDELGRQRCLKGIASVDTFFDCVSDCSTWMTGPLSSCWGIRELIQL